MAGYDLTLLPEPVGRCQAADLKRALGDGQALLASIPRPARLFLPPAAPPGPDGAAGPEGARLPAVIEGLLTPGVRRRRPSKKCFVCRVDPRLRRSTLV
ncbi:hypothetical protein GCM10010495_65290 [Kitasatospora herbaricolor]|nr:hypothetical protein GCM10010495_65290 [Kitasatospora herbaricolor]